MGHILVQKLQDLSILIVEDDDEIRESLTIFLKRFCKQVTNAINGSDGLQMYKEYKPKIVITDIHMPIMNGLKMAKAIRELSDMTQIIILTAFSESELLVEAIESGVNHYLFKPLDMQLFLSVLNRSANDVHIKEELKRKEEFIISQSKLLIMGEMMSMIAHQWRQPISTIAMSANNMFVDIELNEVNVNVLKENIKVINEQVDYLSHTIDDFRDFFKPDKAKELINTEELINSAIVIIGKSLEHHSIILDVVVESSRDIVVFKGELIQVLLNIIKNAKDVLLERCIKNPKISILLKEENTNIIIKICDNGGGIDEAIGDKIFEPYFTTKNEANGTGLGLYMSKIIIEKHLNGSISFKNSHDGVCFYITFPIEAN